MKQNTSPAHPKFQILSTRFFATFPYFGGQVGCCWSHRFPRHGATWRPLIGGSNWKGSSNGHVVCGMSQDGCTVSFLVPQCSSCVAVRCGRSRSVCGVGKGEEDLLSEPAAGRPLARRSGMFHRNKSSRVATSVLYPESSARTGQPPLVLDEFLLVASRGATERLLNHARSLISMGKREKQISVRQV